MTDHELDQQNAAQKRADLARYYPPNFVPNSLERQPHLPPSTFSHSTIVDVPVNSVMVTSLQTTESDRSNGYLKRTIPLSIAFAIVATLAAITLAQEELLSWSALIVFFVAFVGAWMYGEYRYGKASPNVAALLEIERKWDNLDANDHRRWDAWEKATGLIIGSTAQSWVERYKWAIILWAVLSLGWMILIGLFLLEKGR